MPDFALNFMQLLEIDTTPNAATRNYVRLASGIMSAVPSNNEDIAQDKYLDGDGYGSSDVIGAQYIITCSGHRDTEDAAQNYIFSKQLSLGDSRKTNFRRYDAAGNLKSGPVTFCNIDEGSGDAAAKSEIGFELHFNGKPSETAASTAPTADALIETGSTIGTTRFSVLKSDDDNDGKYKLTSESAGTIKTKQYVSGLSDYDEGTLQSMSATCTTGAETAAGTITVTVTTATSLLTGGTDVVEVEVTEDATPAQVAELVKVALEAEDAAGEVGGEFYISRSDATLTLTAKSAAANDVLYNFAVVDTDTTGVVFGAAVDVDAGVVNADISASEGQYLQIYEVDAYDRVVSFYEKALASGDIAS
jgi:hypothetical protein